MRAQPSQSVNDRIRQQATDTKHDDPDDVRKSYCTCADTHEVQVLLPVLHVILVARVDSVLDGNALFQGRTDELFCRATYPVVLEFFWLTLILLGQI